MGGATAVLSFPAAGATIKPYLPLSPSFLTYVTPSLTTFPATKRLQCLTAVAGTTLSTSFPEQETSISASTAGFWVVDMEKPSVAGASRAEVVDYYVETLAMVLGSVTEAQMCICDAYWEEKFGFCCQITIDESRQLARMPGVLSVRPNSDEEYRHNDGKHTNFSPKDQVNSDGYSSKFSSSVESNKYWLVRIEKPGVQVVTKAQMVDHCTQLLTKVLGNEQDAQVCIYNISWEEDYGFCCHIDEECARELADVPGILSVQPDTNFASENKDYRGHHSDPIESNQIQDVRTKRLFVTGLSFYTSEKTLRAAFESFGDLVEVKIIMDKISKRSKGYAFLEYTTEEAAAAALKEMNGKIINGWMIVVDVARTNPPRNSRERLRHSSASTSY